MVWSYAVKTCRGIVGTVKDDKEEEDLLDVPRKEFEGKHGFNG
jgi:hypothetical protein